MQFKIDAGADVSFVAKSSFNRLEPKPKLTRPNAILHSPGGTMQPCGQFVANTHLDNDPFSFRVFVIDGYTDNLLSRDAAVRMGLVRRVNEIVDPAFGDMGQ